MSLALSASFIAKQNSVLPLAQSPSKPGLAIRVASAASDKLGTLTAVGADSASVFWTLNQNPSWVSLSVDVSTRVATLIFSNAEAAAVPYQFYVSANDGHTIVNYPIFLEVRDPLSIVEQSKQTYFNISSYDSTIEDLVFHGIGLNGQVDSDVRFIPPANLPPGMEFITRDGGTMWLRVASPTSSNVAGGIELYQQSGIAMQVTLQAYKPDTMYDSPDRCFTQEITIESTSAKKGVVDLGVTVAYDATLSAFSLTSRVDVLSGQPVPIQYEWTVTGTAQGNISSGGTSSDSSMVWIPSVAGNVGFTLRAKNTDTGQVIGESIIAPTLNSDGSGIPCSPLATWNSTSAIKLGFTTTQVRGYVGEAPQITITTPVAEFNADETLTVDLAVSTGSNLEEAATLSSASVTLSAANPTATVTLTIPESSFDQKWIVVASAANAETNPTRTGYAQIVALSNGKKPLIPSVTGGPNLTSNVGENLAPLTLTATDASSNPVEIVAFFLEGAPAGISINSLNQLVGNVPQAGTYIFRIVAESDGYASSYSNDITLVASTFFAPLVITDAVPSVASLPDGKPFTVSWGYRGAPQTLNLLQGFTQRSVLGSTQIQTSEIGSSVITVYGTSYYGGAYSIPALVISSSITALGNLPDAPTVGIIDEDFELTLKWNPLTINGGYQAYRDWNIWLSQPPNGQPQLQSINGGLPTGLEEQGSSPDARLYVTHVTAGDWQVTMQALTADNTIASNSVGWDAPHAFPTAITSDSVSFDNATVSLGQTLTLSMDATYVGADMWQAIYPDGTTSGWMPISVKSLAKAMNLAGSQSIVIQTQKDYSQSNPPVKLIRQVTKTVYVMNQQYIPPTGSDALTGNLGIGGESGFEITDASAGQVALEPYEVIVRALVRDTLSNELKLMVATARTPDASSLLGTMAIDVFPLPGRPKTKDLIDPSLYLSAEMASQGNPVKIATTTLPNVVVGKPMADFPMQVGINSGVGPFSWYADNLPHGIRLSTDGTLSGTAMDMGAVEVDFSVVDSNTPPFIAHAKLTLTVQSDLKITTTTLPAAVVGTAYNQQIASSGGIPPYIWSLVAGELPVGVSVDPLTGILVGTPVTYNSTKDFNKVYEFTVEVVDAIGALASATLRCTLAPSALQFGPPDQLEIFANEDFEITIPIFGGQPPYNLTTFTDDGTIGNGLIVANSDKVSAVAGVVPVDLSITTPDQDLYPQSYPESASIALEATGGTAPYKFSLLNTNLPDAVIWQNLLASVVVTDGQYSARIRVTDHIGKTTDKTINVSSHQKNAGIYSIKPVSVNTNGSNDPANFTVTVIAALPDAKNGAAYNPGAGTYYGLALYENNQLHMTQNSGVTPMNFSVRSGNLPNGIVGFSGNSFSGSQDFSGIVLFNVSGGQNATVNGNYSFECEFSNIVTQDGGITQAVSRASITVTDAGGGTTPVCLVTSVEPFSVDLSMALPVAPKSGEVSWAYPLTAEGGIGPWTFNLIAGTTLPGATITSANGMTVLTSPSAPVGTYQAVITATSSDGVISASTAIAISVVETPSQPINIVDSNMPSYIYANRAIAANTYYIESDLVGNWAATGLPAGLSLTTSSGNRAYLQGTPTASGNFSPTITVVSTASSLSANKAFQFEVRPQSAVFLNPPTEALVGVQYRVSTNNPIVQVQYTGYFPTDASFPLVTSLHGTVGSPGTLSGGQPTTQVSNLTADGFIMSFDYTNPNHGGDVLTLGNNIATASLTLGYPSIEAVGKTVPITASEYAQTVSADPPVAVTGGLAPYTVTLSGFSDSRFTAMGGKVTTTVKNLPAGQTTSCIVSMLIVDAAGNSTTTTGIVQVTVRRETFIDVTFTNGTWAADISSATPFTISIVPNKLQSVPNLGHSPYQFYVDSVTLPSSLQGFVQISPSKRVLAINCGVSSSTVFDVDQTLTNSGNFIVQSVPFANAPATGSYTIQLGLRVVDSQGLSSNQAVTLTLVIS